jgi:hypothetical protein
MTIAPHNLKTQPKLYDRDFCAWTEAMAEALRSEQYQVNLEGS